MYNRILVVQILVLALAGVCLAQITGIAKRGSGIVVDGNLSDAVWAGAEKIQLSSDVGMQLCHGDVDNNDDASGTFSMLWDDEGFYCASWCKDDVHNAPWTSRPGMVVNAWQDDGHEWWICHDFNDVWEDASPHYYGEFGFQVWKGWTWNNGAPEDKYVAWRNDNDPVGETVEEFKEKGFEAPFTSADGINFMTEAHWKWSSFLLGAMPTPSAGKEIGFNIGIIDNDGGESGDAWIRWSEGSHLNYQGWGKVTLSDEAATIRRVRVLPGAVRYMDGNSIVYDVLGRRIRSTNGMHSAGAVHFSPSRTYQMQKVIRLR